jgi:PTH2 family peptidyl-tRNA hydrolase|tara:strand:- start:26480 stop:26818 length:339 start_codon:yes stop_codon:yes gene_type:complete
MKLVVLVRKDLKMPIGKLAAQVSHAAVEAVLKSNKGKVKEWLKSNGKKVVLVVENTKELSKLNTLAKKNKLITALIRDAGRTFFKKPTITCLGIGPDKEEKIDKITKNLKML